MKLVKAVLYVLGFDTVGLIAGAALGLGGFSVYCQFDNSWCVGGGSIYGPGAGLGSLLICSMVAFLSTLVGIFFGLNKAIKKARSPETSFGKGILVFLVFIRLSYVFSSRDFRAAYLGIQLSL